MSYDLLIRGGTVVDGTGAPAFKADVGVRDGKIARIAESIEDSAARTIDATGQLVTPGFVDVHTHYDGQATWDTHMTPSSNLGATTVVMGNCGVGFAPCRETDRDALIELMEGVEEIPDVVMAEGLPWNWESFGDFLDALDERSRDVDIAVLYPHGPLRVYVMGQRGLDREPATEQDIAEMKRLLAKGLDEGAVGFSTSRTLVHRTLGGTPVPTFKAANEELKALGEELSGDRGHVFQMIADWRDAEDEFSILSDTARTTGAKATFTLLIIDGLPTLWREHLERIDRSQAEGLDIRGQVLSRPLGMMFGLNTSMTPFSATPTMRAMEHLSLEEKVAELSKPLVREQILNEDPDTPHVFMQFFADKFQAMFPMEDPVEYLPNEDDSVASIAKRDGRHPKEWLYDYLLQDGGHSLIYLPSVNFEEELIPELLKHDHTVPALGDGGAHVGSICDSSSSIYLLTKWVRDEGLFDIEHGIHLLTERPAELYSLADRGRLKEGLKADINVLNLDALQLRRPHIVADLPAGGKRLQQSVDGLRATVVSGKVIFEDGQATGELPGKVVRGQQPPPEWSQASAG
ncbi:MAG: D-aminoacylase [Pseudomonadaceae bacterium]|nr:D-aminoacylase [Pseudomonadaceae bacterium]